MLLIKQFPEKLGIINSGYEEPITEGSFNALKDLLLDKTEECEKEGMFFVNEVEEDNYIKREFASKEKGLVFSLIIMEGSVISSTYNSGYGYV